MKKLLYFIGVIIIISTIFSLLIQFEDDRVNVLVLYESSSKTYTDIYQHYKQSLIANLRAEYKTLDSLRSLNPSKYQVVYLDQSLAESDKLKQKKDILINYVNNGGGLFLENSFYNSFPADFIGASEFKAISSLPKEIIYPEVRGNLTGLQELVRDYYSLFIKFNDLNARKNLTFGYGIIPTTAETLASSQGVSLYTMNRVGKGFVYFTNSILPNSLYVNSFDMQPKDKDQKYFNPTSASANYLIRNEFAAFIAKEKYGYVLKKVLGTNGRPAMAWQNHFEVTSAIKNASMQKWIDFLKDYKEVPSFSLSRSTFEWGQWRESINYHLNVGTNENPKFIGEEEESQYSSGKHALVNGQYLTIQPYPEYKSLSWPIEMPHRAFPSASDMDNDGITDIVSGSSDGNIYFFKGKANKEGWNFEDRIKLTSTDKTPINLGSFSAPVIFDINYDGKKDLIIGNQEGKLFSYINQGSLTFDMPSEIVTGLTELKTISPDIGDIDGDHIEDLIYGDSLGHIYVLKGYKEMNSLKFMTAYPLENESNSTLKVGRYAAPKLFDLDGNGILDIVVGYDEGYIRRFKNQYPKFTYNGYMEGSTLNPFGNSHLWGGHNTVPFIIDINQDGKADLGIGQLEFGMAVPIDSPSYPYKEELKNAISYTEKNNISIQPHLYFHNYKSEEQEKKEIELHKKAFEYNNIPWQLTGANQHTWRINNSNSTQTMLSESKNGIWWNSGFRPSNNPVEPSLGWEYAWNFPFLLSNKEKNENMLLFNAALNIPNYEEAYPNIAKFDMPISYFFHIEYDMLSEEGRKGLSYKAQFLNRFRNENDYNFMTEEQMAKSFMAALKTRYSINSNILKKVFNNIESNMRKCQHKELLITSDKTEIPNYTKDYADSLGLKIETGEKFNDLKFNTNTKIYMR
ncbi:MAG: repeat protein, partial [Clostridiales bacterium]|nr:repeat protein [Clostridiales bacterium]